MMIESIIKIVFFAGIVVVVVFLAGYTIRSKQNFVFNKRGMEREKLRCEKSEREWFKQQHGMYPPKSKVKIYKKNYHIVPKIFLIIFCLPFSFMTWPLLIIVIFKLCTDIYEMRHDE